MVKARVNPNIVVVVGRELEPNPSASSLSLAEGEGPRRSRQGIMTAVLSPTDALRRDRHLSLDDNHIKYDDSNDATSLIIR